MLTLKHTKLLLIAVIAWTLLAILIPATSHAQFAVYTCSDGTKRVVNSNLSEEDKQSFCGANNPPRTTEECNQVASAQLRQLCLEVEATRPLPDTLALVNCPDGTRRTVPKRLSQEDRQSFCNNPARTIEQCNQIANAAEREACKTFEANQTTTVPGLPPPDSTENPVSGDGRLQLGGDCKNEDLSTNCGIVEYIRLAIRVLSAAVGIVVVLMITIGGVQYSASRDNPQATAAAKGRVTNAIIALVVYLFMMTFLQYIVPGGVI